MRISSSEVAMDAQYAYRESRTRNEQLTVWTCDRDPRAAPARGARADRLTLSDDARRASRRHHDDAKRADKAEKSKHTDHDDMPPKLMALKLMIEAITGQKIRVMSSEDLQATPSEMPSCPDSGSKQPAATGEQRAGWGVEYHAQTHYEETQTLNFSAAGVIKTQDGQEIQFALDLSIQRSYVEDTQIAYRAGDAVRPVDPLVINFNGLASELTSTRFTFDLDADGADEQMPFVAPGSGLLALDRNGDGVVNDGSELFGPKTGNALAELAAFDVDGNQWIDEQDAIFAQLAVWQKDAAGQDSLTSLGDAGVGAIYLGAVASRLDYKDAVSNALLARTQQLGLYLRENGTPGSLQQMDFVV